MPTTPPTTSADNSTEYVSTGETTPQQQTSDNTTPTVADVTANTTMQPYPRDPVPNDDSELGKTLGLALGITFGVIIIIVIVLIVILRKKRIKKKKRKQSPSVLPTTSEVDREIEKSKKDKKKKRKSKQKKHTFDNSAFEDASKVSSVSHDYVNVPDKKKEPKQRTSPSQQLYLDPESDNRTLYTSPEYGAEYYMEKQEQNSAAPKLTKRNNDSPDLETYEDVDQASKGSSDSSGSRRNKKIIQKDNGGAAEGLGYENVKGIKPPPHRLYQNLNKNETGKMKPANT